MKSRTAQAAYQWDFFVAHAGADKERALELDGYLRPHSRVFLDAHDLLLGDDWDRALRNAQQSSLITVVLISSRTDSAYYQREEIAAAIAMAREDETKHRLIPVFLDAMRSADVPYGLRLKHSAHLSEDVTLRDVAALLLSQLPKIRSGRGKSKGAKPGASAPAPISSSKVSLTVSAHFESPVDLAEPSIHTLRYEGGNEKGVVQIRRTMPYLSMLENGGSIEPIRFNWVPFQWAFPKLDFKVLNNSSETVYFTELVFEVKESRLDPSPVLLIKPDSYGSNALHFRLINDGWGPARQAKARFHLIPLKKDMAAMAKFKGPYPYEVEIGDVKEGANVDIADAFAAAGVDFKRLEALAEWTSWGETLTFEDAEGKEWSMSEKKFLAERVACLGPFRNNGALVSGVLEYGAKSIGKGIEQRSVKFETIVWVINANRKGMPRPPSYEYATKFEVSGRNYERRVSISQELKAGEADRFLVQIGFDKSSLHRFRARLLYNGQREIVSPEIELLGFAPRSGIRFMREGKAQKPPV